MTENDFAELIDLNCEGINGAILNLSKSLDEQWQRSIQTLGLGQARTIEVWPAGLTAFSWDGEGHGEWYASERSMLPIQTDHPIASIRISLENDSKFDLELSSIEPGVPVFIELPNLPVGVHKLRFSFASGLAGEFARIDDRQAVICILEDRSYSSITDLRGPLSVQIDPPMPTMEQLWKVESKSRFEDPKLGRSKAKCRSARMRRNKRSLPGDFPLSISRCP